MKVFLSSPNNQLQARMAAGMDVLISYAVHRPWLDQWLPSFASVLGDCGAYTFFQGGKEPDVSAYKEWAEKRRKAFVACAGVDDIAGDWRKSWRNYQLIEWGFPTIHDSDPPEFLADIVAMEQERARQQERKPWLGIGLVPPREGKERFVRWVCNNVPDSFRVHGFALRAYAHVERLDSADSNNWWKDGMKVRRDLPWLTYGEALEIVVKRYQREARMVAESTAQGGLFAVTEDAA